MDNSLCLRLFSFFCKIKLKLFIVRTLNKEITKNRTFGIKEDVPVLIVSNVKYVL